MAHLNNPGFCSLFVAVDNFYLGKLLHSFPTWVMLKPEILNMPQVLVYDAGQVSRDDPRWSELARIYDAAVRHHRARDPGVRAVGFRPMLVPWSMPNAQSQRERMLTSLIRCTPSIPTPWYLKLDADTYARAPGGWYFDRWFSQSPCYVSSPWNYTKPGGTIAQMNRWAATVPQLRNHPDVEFTTVTLAPGKTKDVHPRMASWVMFGNTEWSRWANGLCQGDRLPFPSQDTYLSYVQARTKKLWIPARWRQMGWEHCRNPDGLARACQEALHGVGGHV